MLAIGKNVGNYSLVSQARIELASFDFADLGTNPDFFALTLEH